MVKFFEHYPIIFKNILGGSIKYFKTLTLKLKLLFIKFLNSTPLPLRIFGGVYKIFLDSKNMIGNKGCSKTALYRC